MKILFICTQNVGRSQMAAALYNSLSADGHADAAGTRVDEPGQTLTDKAKHYDGAQYVLDVMHEDGLNLSHKTRRQIGKDMLDNYDQIIVMAEPDTIPDYLRDHPKAVYWDIASPSATNIDGTRTTRDELKRRIVDLLG